MKINVCVTLHLPPDRVTGNMSHELVGAKSFEYDIDHPRYLDNLFQGNIALGHNLYAFCKDGREQIRYNWRENLLSAYASMRKCDKCEVDMFIREGWTIDMKVVAQYQAENPQVD